jgi:hypothetical protein
MSEPDRNAIDEALARYLDGEPEPGDIELLAVAMHDDERFARQVGRLLMVDDLIRQRAMRDTQAFLEVLETRLAAERDGGRFIRELARRLRRGSIPVPRRWPWLPWTLAAAVVLMVVLTVLLWPRGRRGAPPALVPAPPLASATALDGLAMVTQLDAARWEPESGPPPREGDVVSARRLRLRQGRAVLAFLSGVTLTVEGPADLDLVSIDRVFCRRGRLRARVPRGAEGFVVASPSAAVVDLGTEFALNVEADGEARILVVEGAAEAALLDAAGTPLLTRFVEQSKAFVLEPGTGLIAEAPARPDGFVVPLTSTAPSLNLDPGYAGAVLRSRPRGYWRFESLAGGAVPDEVPGGRPLRVHGPVALSGQTNGCVVFRAGAPEQFLTTDGLWELARRPGHAVEFWFSADGFHRAALISLFPPRDLLPPEQAWRYFHTSLVELTVRGRQSLHKPATVRFLHAWPLEIRSETNIYSPGLYVPGRWHHVVIQRDGDRMEIYFDGVPGRSRPIEPDYPTLSCHLVVGRRTPDPLATHDSRSFVGRLDELAIYDHPLSAEEVRHHFDLAAPGRRPESIPANEEQR